MAERRRSRRYSPELFKLAVLAVAALWVLLEYLTALR